MNPSSLPTALADRITAIIPTLGGWCSVEKGHDLARAVLDLSSAVTVEIGVWCGRSVLPMALAHKHQGSGTVWAIDPWSSKASVEGYDAVNAEWWGKINHDDILHQFKRTLKAYDVESVVNIVRAKSDDVEPPKGIALLHIDGQHTDQAVKDVERFAANVITGGMVFVDDIAWSGGGVGRAVEKLLAMGFTKKFDRDTGAMFERQQVIAAAPSPLPRARRNPGRKKKVAAE